MSQLWLRVVKELDGDNIEDIVYCELRGPGIEGSRVLMLPAGLEDRWREEEVDGGLYFVHVTLPSGQLLSRHAQVPPNAAEPVKLPIEPAHSAHEHLSWPQFLGLVQTDLSYEAFAVRRRPESGLDAQPMFDRFPTTDQPVLALWAGSDVGQPQPPVVLRDLDTIWAETPQGEYVAHQTQVSRDEESLVVSFRPTSGPPGGVQLAGRKFLQVAGRDESWMASLPLPWWSTLETADQPAQVAVMLHAPPGDHEPTLTVVLRDWLMGPLLGYLVSSRVGIVDTLRAQFLDDAEQLLYQKRVNPYAAVVGGLILLKFQVYDRLHDWPYNLASWFPWLPDGAVIGGWCGLRGIGPNDEARSTFNGAEPRELFLAAARRGVPVYTEALYLLVDGLKRCLAEAEGKHETDDEVAAALDKMRRFARACDPHQAFTVFRGFSPDEPIISD